METAINASLTNALVPALPSVSGGSSGSMQLASGTSGTQMVATAIDCAFSATQVLPLGFNTLTGPNSSGRTFPAATAIECAFTGTQISAWLPLESQPSGQSPPPTLPPNANPPPSAFFLGALITRHLVKTAEMATDPRRTPSARLTFAAGAFVGTTLSAWKPSEAALRIFMQQSAWASPDMLVEYTSGQRIFDAIQALYLSHNKPRDRQIAERLTTLYRDTLAEDEHIIPDSLTQFTEFFLSDPDLGTPKITLTPDGTLRARWLHGPGNFVAIEFTGEPSAKLVAEIPRDRGLIATYFGSEPIEGVVTIARGLGASFT